VTRDLRKRLERALEKGDVHSAGAGVGKEMRRRLDRALSVAGAGDPPLPRVYAADRLLDPGRLEDPDTLTPVLPGGELETPFGPVQQRRWKVALKELAAVQDLEGASEGSSILAGLLGAPELADLDPDEALYLDTETTGLAGGTGTYVFLLGLGWVEGDAFVVEQLFLRDFTEEAALLHRAGELVDCHRTLVSFNGQRYDLPLLDTRRVLNRMRGTFSERPHLDLLKPARLLYRGRFEDCRLQTLEKELMGQVREEDIPGAEIPGRYFDFLSGEEPAALLPVFEHNLLDVVTLLTLTAHFLHLGLQPELDPRALGGLGRLHERRGNREIARELLELARSRRVASYRDLRDLGFLYKRQGEHRRAQDVWKMLIRRQEKPDRELPFDPIPYVEMAKHLEHRVSDFGRALAYTDAALQRASAASCAGSSSRLERDLLHRSSRLQRRLDVRDSG